MMRKTHTRLAMLGLSTALTGFVAQGASAAQVFATDLIVQGSACIGLDCSSSESFGFDTLRLKENNLRIHFQDTSASASFPTRDWRIVANDSGNGGAEYLAIEDSDAGNQPFRVDAGAGANALRINSSGNIGIGTASPVVELHVADGDSPTLRLEQNGSAGFTAQTWDIAGNETNFFVRDVTNGSELPFKIKPGADDNALFVAASNNIGLNTDSPTAPLHVRHTAALNGASPHIYIQNTNSTRSNRTALMMSNKGGSQIILEDSENALQWKMAHRNAGNQEFFILDEDNADGVEFTLDRSGNLTITGNLTTGGSGACNAGCDRVFDANYEMPTIEEHAAYMWDNQHLPAVGATIEGEPMNLTHKVGGMLNELEKAHIYIEQLNDRIALLETQLQAQN